MNVAAAYRRLSTLTHPRRRREYRELINALQQERDMALTLYKALSNATQKTPDELLTKLLAQKARQTAGISNQTISRLNANIAAQNNPAATMASNVNNKRFWQKLNMRDIYQKLNEPLWPGKQTTIDAFDMLPNRFKDLDYLNRLGLLDVHGLKGTKTPLTFNPKRRIEDITHVKKAYEEMVDPIRLTLMLGALLPGAGAAGAGAYGMLRDNPDKKITFTNWYKKMNQATRQ